MRRKPFINLDPLNEDSREINVIIETPKGSRNKFNYDEELDIFKLAGVLPAGAVFPFDFGFAPSTQGGDGDPLDVLVLMDEPAFTGCLVPSRLLGVIVAEQTEKDGETMRNDRLIAVASKAHQYADARTLTDLGENLVAEIEHFFISYNVAKGKEFKPLGRFGPQKARQLLEEAIAVFRRETSKTSGKKKRAVVKSSAGKKKR